MLDKAVETEVCRTEIEAPNAWLGADLAGSRDWLLHLETGDIDELETALRQCQATGKSLTDVTAEDFPLPAFTQRLDTIKRELTEGRGFMVLRGLPVGDRFTEDEAKTIHWALGRHLGRPIAQNARGDLLGHVIDRKIAGANKRSYESNAAQAYHADQSDVVALLCLRQAKSGGMSTIASSVSMHNIMLEERPDLLELLYKTYYCDRMGEEAPGHPPYYASPVYTYVRGQLTCRPAYDFVLNAQRFDEVPRITEAEKEAMELLQSIPRRDGVAFDYLLEPGDIQYLNNYCVLHGRSSWEDHDDLDKRRYLVRLWLTLDHEFQLTPEFEARRKGLPLADDVQPSVSLEPRDVSLAH